MKFLFFAILVFFNTSYANECPEFEFKNVRCLGIHGFQMSLKITEEGPLLKELYAQKAYKLPKVSHKKINGKDLSIETYCDDRAIVFKETYDGNATAITEIRITEDSSKLGILKKYGNIGFEIVGYRFSTNTPSGDVRLVNEDLVCVERTN